MGRIRTIKPEFFESESLGSVSREARLLFAGLFVLADDEGRMRWMPKKVAGELYPWDEDIGPEAVERWVAELERITSVVRYVSGHHAYLAIPGWRQHQRLDHPRPSRFPPPPEDCGIPPENCGIPPEDCGTVSEAMLSPSMSETPFFLDDSYPQTYPQTVDSATKIVNSATIADIDHDGSVTEPITAGQDRNSEDCGIPPENCGIPPEDCGTVSEDCATGNRKKEKGNRIYFGPPKADPKKRRRRIPDDFALTESLREFPVAQKAAKGGINLDEEFQRFRDYHLGKGTLMLDWEAAWRTWCGNALRWAPKRSDANPFLDMMREGK